MNKTPIAFSSGIYYIDIEEAAIHPFFIVTDGVHLVRFGNEKRVYMRLDDAIAWHEKELAKIDSNGGNQRALDAMLKIKAKAAAGKIEFHDDPPPQGNKS